MKQNARELTNFEDGFLSGKQYILMDRNGKFWPTFRDFLNTEGTQPLRLPPRSPDLHAHIERFMRSIKSECLSRMIFFGETSLRLAMNAYIRHYHLERNHQGLDNQIIDPSSEIGHSVGKIECRERLGGLLKYYYCDAA